MPATIPNPLNYGDLVRLKGGWKVKLDTCGHGNGKALFQARKLLSTAALEESGASKVALASARALKACEGSISLNNDIP